MAGKARSAEHNEMFALEGEAHGLADRLPDLVLEAMRIVSTVTHGIHGRRRAGPGETFWQFRQFGESDTASQIDWRRSASSDHLYVREREWEAAHTVWLWSNLSSSMQFSSHLAGTSKRDRAIVLMLAVGELLVRGGERIAVLGLTRPSANRKSITRIAEALTSEAGTSQTETPLPPSIQLTRFSGAILFSDFLEPLEAIEQRLQQLAADGVSGHLVQILDPAEETLPYSGRAEFESMDGSYRWLADRTEAIRPQYRDKLLAHRAGLEDIARRLGWSFLVHHTDRPAAEPLLSLIMRLQGIASNYRWTSTGAGVDTSIAAPDYYHASGPELVRDRPAGETT